MSPEQIRGEPVGRQKRRLCVGHHPLRDAHGAGAVLRGNHHRHPHEAAPRRAAARCVLGGRDSRLSPAAPPPGPGEEPGGPPVVRPRDGRRLAAHRRYRGRRGRSHEVRPGGPPHHVRRGAPSEPARSGGAASHTRSSTSTMDTPSAARGSCRPGWGCPPSRPFGRCGGRSWPSARASRSRPPPPSCARRRRRRRRWQGTLHLLPRCPAIVRERTPPPASSAPLDTRRAPAFRRTKAKRLPSTIVRAREERPAHAPLWACCTTPAVASPGMLAGRPCCTSGAAAAATAQAATTWGRCTSSGRSVSRPTRSARRPSMAKPAKRATRRGAATSACCACAGRSREPHATKR